MNKINNERGFMLLNVIFLTLITSFAAMILFNAAPRIRNPQSVLRLTAIHLANKQFALMESKAADGDENFYTVSEELKTKNFGEGKEITLNATTKKISSDKNLHVIKVTVEWTVDEENFKFEEERTIRVVPKKIS